MTDLHDGIRAAKSVEELKNVISSMLDIQNKMTSAASAEVSPHINDDYPLGNFQKDDELSLKRNFVLARTALDMGADDAYMNYLHENNEIANITRGRLGFQNKIMRATITQGSQTIKEEQAGGWGFGRSKENSQQF